MNHKIFILFISLFIFIFVSCAPKPKYMKYDVIFYAKLGTNINEIGSNYDQITNYFTNEKSFLASDYLDVPTSFRIFRNKLYIADKYNKRVSIFNLTGEITNTPILSSNESYSFGIPFQVALNKYGEIFIVASQSDYSEQYYNLITNENFKKNYNFNQFYIYKFSVDGRFIFSIGDNGIHSEPMAYPDRIDIDLFDNIYAYFRDFDENDREYWVVKRFSPSGELSFEFSTKYLSITNNINNSIYIGRVNNIHNLKNDEKLLISTENYLISKNGISIEQPDEFYNSLDIYSVLQNAINRNIFKTEKYMDQIIAVTMDDVIVLNSYDERFHCIRFRFIDFSSLPYKEEFYYAPIISSFYQNFGFFVDDYGKLYSIIVKDYSYFVILQWRKVKSRVHL